PGQIVGIVGPNGCGKSNIIDALRWVLGESRASALRGKSMQDVIFSGSGNRKPVARASVELVFDNSLGRAAGQWSEYAEIAVRRVLQRDAESSYFINNVKVRRKDVADVFLGTGLGGHAYAIIEQGMISRIIEADPEELKVFLEEAAGISKYRERRRETELRLKATSENLRRVEDILSEIGGRITHLESQAAVAARYHELQNSLKTTRNLLWLRKKMQAEELRKKLIDEAGRLENELEAEKANLARVEHRLVEMREAHDVAGNRLQETQGEMYKANAEVSGLQQQIDHMKSNRANIEKRIESEKRESDALHLQLAEAFDEKARLENEIGQARHQKVRCEIEFETFELQCTESGEKLKKARQAHEEARLALSRMEQEGKIGLAGLEHVERTLDQLQKRREKLAESGSALQQPDEAGLFGIDEALEDVVRRLENGKIESSARSEKLEAARKASLDASAKRNSEERKLAEISARLAALREIQAGIGSDLESWLHGEGCEDFPRLRSKLRVGAGWENALESVLKERVNAVLIDRPPGIPPAEAVFVRSGEASEIPSDKSLLRLLELEEPAFGAALEEWLSAIDVAETLDEALAVRSMLKGGKALLTPEGHLVTKHSIHYRGEEPGLQGVLARQKEIERLLISENEASASLDDANKSLSALEGEVFLREKEAKEAAAAIPELEKERHDLQLKRIRLAEMIERSAREARRIESELQEVEAQLHAENGRRLEMKKGMVSSKESLELAQAHSNRLRQELHDAENLYEEEGVMLRKASDRKREAEFIEKSCALKIAELENRKGFLEKKAIQLVRNLESLQEEFASIDIVSLEERLQQALVVRQEREAMLLEARKANEALSEDLRELDGKRHQSELKMTPLRERINGVLLKEQEARIAGEQFDASLKAAGADEDMLFGMLQDAPDERQLAAGITKLNGEIESLGAVNLAAFDELKTAMERIGYLDLQISDLREAAVTLEDAIRRIDRETRELLLDTYEAVNRHFKELFGQLFGGGQASLVLTGEQIIDCGMEIEAQPPGKKNASIRLLSGGEKALTAISLVFSLFKLNPAPFCLLDEVDAPLDDSNTERFCDMVRKMAEHTQFLFISHNKITMEMANQLIGVTMQEQGVSRIVAVDVEAASRQSGVIMAN
ncbi:MAG TPA: chromosome segregation protein SMC, partial [Burkholderiales bacterium]|nr:chromosome segregation protein SMC [Burkholderiales bacterium]